MTTMKKKTAKFRKIAADVMAVERRSKEEDFQVCVHEAAHVMAGWRLPWADTPHYVTVNPNPDRMTAGFVNDMSVIVTREQVKAILKIRQPKKNLEIMKARGIAPMTRKDRLAHWMKTTEDSVIVSLAGPAADMRMKWDFMDGDGGEHYSDLNNCYGNRANDDESWREVLREILAWDDDSGDWGRAMRKLSAFEDDERRREEWLLRVWCRSVRFVDKHWAEIKRFAKILQKKRTLDRNGMFEALEKRGTGERRSA